MRTLGAAFTVAVIVVAFCGAPLTASAVTILADPPNPEISDAPLSFSWVFSKRFTGQGPQIGSHNPPPSDPNQNPKQYWRLTGIFVSEVANSVSGNTRSDSVFLRANLTHLQPPGDSHKGDGVNEIPIDLSVNASGAIGEAVRARKPIDKDHGPRNRGHFDSGFVELFATVQRSAQGSTRIFDIVDYRAEIKVQHAPVPLPGGVWLVMTALGAICGFGMVTRSGKNAVGL